MPDAVKHTGALALTRGFQLKVVFFIIILLLASLGAAGALIYFTASQELGNSFFTAHRDLRLIWKGLLPLVLLVSTGVGVLSCLLALLVLHRFKRSLERTGIGLMKTIEMLGRGNMGAEAAADEARHLRPVAGALDRTVVSIRQHLGEVKGISMELQRTVMKLNYLALEREGVTLSELRSLSANLNTLSRELINALKWFES